jgi:small ligand-binding sensory domain FIST
MAESQQMRWASAVSQRVDARHALAEISEVVLDELGGPPDLALLFVSCHYQNVYDAIPGWAQSLLSPRHLLGCAASGVLGTGEEVERREAMSVIAARLPGVELFPFHVSEGRWPSTPAAWTEVTGMSPDSAAGFIVMADPSTLEADAFLKGIDAAYPSAPKIGGLVSGIEEPGDAALFLDDRVLRHGALALGMRGRIELQTAVSQSCRPVGEPMIITRCRDSIIQELNVGKPVEVLQQLFEKLEPRDQELCRHSLFLGIEMVGRSHRYGLGDFLVRSLAGLEPNSGAMAVQAHFNNYQVVQFHLRDARTSAQDMERHLAELQRSRPKALRGALMFSCLGRGQELYGVPNHESELVCRHLGGLPVGGFFANGEIGPVGGRTFVHGYTSVFGAFCEPVLTAKPGVSKLEHALGG